MPSFNNEVFKAIFDVYITSMRADWWGIKLDKDTDEEIRNKIPKQKRDIITNLLSESVKLRASDLELDLIFRCYKKEKEDEQYEKDKNFVEKQLAKLERVVTWKEPELFLQKTIKAGRAYLISCLIKEKKLVYDNTLADLNGQKKELEEQIEAERQAKLPADSIAKNEQKLQELKDKIECLTLSPKFTDSYFDNYISKKDPQSTELKETSFKDFVDNIITGKRKILICNRILPKPDGLPDGIPEAVIPSEQAKTKEVVKETKANPTVTDTTTTPAIAPQLTTTAALTKSNFAPVVTAAVTPEKTSTAPTPANVAPTKTATVLLTPADLSSKPKPPEPQKKKELNVSASHLSLYTQQVKVPGPAPAVTASSVETATHGYNTRSKSPGRS